MKGKTGAGQAGKDAGVRDSLRFVWTGGTSADILPPRRGAGEPFEMPSECEWPFAKGQAPFAGTAGRVLCTKGSCPFSRT